MMIKKVIFRDLSERKLNFLVKNIYILSMSFHSKCLSQIWFYLSGRLWISSFSSVCSPPIQRAFIERSACFYDFFSNFQILCLLVTYQLPLVLRSWMLSSWTTHMPVVGCQHKSMLHFSMPSNRHHLVNLWRSVHLRRRFFWGITIFWHFYSIKIEQNG